MGMVETEAVVNLDTVPNSMYGDDISDYEFDEKHVTSSEGNGFCGRCDWRRAYFE